MEHTVIPLIYPDVRNVSTSVIGRVEKDQIPSLCFGQGDMLRHVVLFLRRPWHGDSSLAKAPLDKTGTVKGGSGGSSAEHVPPALIF